MKSNRQACGLFVVLATAWLAIAGSGVAYAADATVFDSAPARTVPLIRDGVPLAGRPMRTLTVVERIGVARTSELVRVPLFFHDGECGDPQELVIYDLADPSKKAIPYQADDIRKTESGEVARMHAYFYVDLKPWERKQFGVIKGKNPAAQMPLVSMVEGEDNVVFKGDDITAGFIVKGPHTGAVSQLETKFGKLNLLDGFIAPQLRLVRQDLRCAELRRSEIDYDKPEGFEVREIKYAAGALFAKLRVKIGPVGTADSAETTYMIPRIGSLMIITQRTFPEDPESGDVVGSDSPVVLRGRVSFGAAEEAAANLAIPTGLRKIIRETQNQKVEALVATKSGFSIINIPSVSDGGGETHYQADDPQLQGDQKTPPARKFMMEIMGPGLLKRHAEGNSNTLRAFWSQSRFLFAPTTDFESLWDDVRTGQNGLTAVVDEPGVMIDDLANAFSATGKLFYNIRNWGKGWQQEAAMAYLTGDDAAVKKLLGIQSKTPDTSHSKRGDQAKMETWIPDWVKQQMQAADFKPPLTAPDDFVWKNIALDPYNQGYANSCIVPFAAVLGPSDRLDQMCYAIGRGSMLTNGGVYADGFPHITSFSNAYNMQIGSMYFGIYSGKKLKDPWMTMFYRDINKANGTACIFGHGQRGYSGNMGQGGPSDILYQAICDSWLRSIELVCNENLAIHPATYARFTDTIDVTSDLQHRTLNPATNWSQYRGNFFRAQQHDHRWESWDAMPYEILLQNADEEIPAGLTEAVYFAREQAAGLSRTGKTPNWSMLMNFFHPLFDLRTARHDYQPPTLPPLPNDVKVEAAAKGVKLTWSPVETAVGYRVYRSGKIGKPLTFLNSPYLPEKRAELIKNTNYVDADGSVGMFYFVTAVDKAGQESSWFPDEPAPRPGKHAR